MCRIFLRLLVNLSELGLYVKISITRMQAVYVYADNLVFCNIFVNDSTFCLLTYCIHCHFQIMKRDIFGDNNIGLSFLVLRNF